ncbi:MAG TPA: hypothetical protein VNT26_11225 [Candidatus Sulfotelmatobacter sp.]|nr:hypothetical protein [Candidatus Sulfotelmatobacter sp.]
MTAQSDSGNLDLVWRRVFQCCQGLLIGLVCTAFLADFFAKSMFRLDLLALGFPTALLLLVVAVVAWVCRGAGRRRWYQLALLLVWLLLFVGIYRTGWPMRWSFAASTPALDRLAEQVAAGQTPSLPTRAGAYLIRAVETRPVSGGVAICLWSYPPENHHIGFVRSPAGVTPQVNPWTHRQLSPRWHHFAAD